MQMSCDTQGLLQWMSAGLAFLAAAFWFCTVLVRIPPLTYTEADELPRALRKQSLLNGIAAACAAGAAVLQAVLILAPSCVKYS